MAITHSLSKNLHIIMKQPMSASSLKYSSSHKRLSVAVNKLNTGIFYTY